jgi:hypothetical protein
MDTALDDGRDNLMNLRFMSYDEFTGFPFTASISRGLRFGDGDKSFPEILVRVANPVEPLGFKIVSNHLLPPLLQGVRDRPGKEPDLPDQLDEAHTKQFQGVHKRPTNPPAWALIPLTRPVWVSRAAIRFRRQGRGLRRPAV